MLLPDACLVGCVGWPQLMRLLEAQQRAAGVVHSVAVLRRQEGVAARTQRQGQRVHVSTGAADDTAVLACVAGEERTSV